MYEWVGTNARRLPIAFIACLLMGCEQGSFPTRLEEATVRLAAVDEAVPTGDVVSDLEIVRSLGAGNGSAISTLRSFASDRSPLYSNRDKFECTRLYAYVLLVLSEIDAIDEILPRAADLVAHGHTAHEIAVGARIIASAGPHGKPMLPLLTTAVFRFLHDEPLSLERYSTRFPPGERTTARVELVRAIVAIDPDPHLAKDILGRLYRQHSASLGPGSATTALQREIEEALILFKTRSS
jgi:hypothetical protein